MTVTVKMLVEVEFEARGPNEARAAAQRVPGDLAHSIQHGVLGSHMTGVVAGTVKVAVKEKQIGGE